MTKPDIVAAAAHPEEMRVEAELRTAGGTVLRASARATPAGLVAVGVLVSAVLLSTAVLVDAALGGGVRAPRLPRRGGGG